MRLIVNIPTFYFIVIMIFCFSYIKKLIEDSQMCEDAIKLLQYICWENPIMSKKILIELLSYMSISHISDVKCIAEYIVCLLRMEDSWMAPRIVNTFNGTSFHLNFRSHKFVRFLLLIFVCFKEKCIMLLLCRTKKN